MLSKAACATGACFVVVCCHSVGVSGFASDALTQLAPQNPQPIALALHVEEVDVQLRFHLRASNLQHAFWQNFDRLHA